MQRPLLKQWPTMQGHLIHARVEKEYARAQSNQKSLSDRGRQGASIRWGKHPTEASATANGQGNATAIAQAMLGDAPSPSPSPKEKDKSIVEDFILDGSSVSSQPKEDPITPLVEAGWRYFLEQTGRHSSQYKLTPDRSRMGRRGFESLIAFAKERQHPKPLDAAAELFRVAVDRMVSSPFHSGDNDQGRRYNDWHQFFAGKGFPAPRKLLEYWLDDNRWSK
jgi:hypothetical protein